MPAHHLIPFYAVLVHDGQDCEKQGDDWADLVQRCEYVLASVGASHLSDWVSRDEDCYWLKMLRHCPEPNSVA